MTQITKNLQRLNQSAPSSGRSIDESGNIANIANLNGAPYIIPTDDVSKWLASFPDTSIAQDSSPFYGGSVVATREAGASSDSFFTILEQEIDLRQFINGKIRFFASTTDTGTITSLATGFVSDANLQTGNASLFGGQASFPQGYQSGAWALLEADIKDFVFTIIGSSNPNIARTQGFFVSLGATGSVKISGVHILI